MAVFGPKLKMKKDAAQPGVLVCFSCRLKTAERELGSLGAAIADTTCAMSICLQTYSGLPFFYFSIVLNLISFQYLCFEKFKVSILFAGSGTGLYRVFDPRPVSYLEHCSNSRGDKSCKSSPGP